MLIMENKISLVNIILPHYNKFKFLKETIDSIINHSKILNCT